MNRRGIPDYHRRHVDSLSLQSETTLRCKGGAAGSSLCDSGETRSGGEDISFSDGCEGCASSTSPTDGSLELDKSFGTITSSVSDGTQLNGPLAPAAADPSVPPAGGELRNVSMVGHFHP